MAKRDYTKDGTLTVHWDSDLCIHSAECIRAQRGVFRPKERPWIHVEAAAAEAIAAAVDMCPSGALAYTWLELQQEDGQAAADGGSSAAAGSGAAGPSPEAGHVGTATIRVTSDGPYEVVGPVEIVDDDGSPLASVRKTWLCRCGHSGNKPFCDGSHRRVGFSDPRGPGAATVEGQ
jgi:CDGSH-type Zn-finger protein/uncharacterized Fe-S cluster protein YjdI